jgi:hypothetical protein
MSKKAGMIFGKVINTLHHPGQGERQAIVYKRRKKPRNPSV